MELKINGKTYEVDVEPNMPLLWVLRDELNLTGTKYGCGVAFCGACTVHLDGQPVRSCVLPAAALAGKEITTIEGIGENDLLSKIQEAWVAQQVPQCGYCQSGMIMAIEGLFKKNPSPTEAELETAITNICRCGTYQRVKEAVMKLSEEHKEA
ncbi:MAG: (2Fe-2S)-binding protein [Roseivirga sp.]